MQPGMLALGVQGMPARGWLLGELCLLFPEVLDSSLLRAQAMGLMIPVQQEFSFQIHLLESTGHCEVSSHSLQGLLPPSRPSLVGSQLMPFPQGTESSGTHYLKTT